MNIDAVVFIMLSVSIILLALKMYLMDEKIKALGILIVCLMKKTGNADTSGDKGNENRCVCCDEVIPEGTQYCYTCGKKAEKGEC